MYRNATNERRDVGETLVEILLTIVIIGTSVTGLLSSLATAGNAGNVQRGGVQADTVLRSYAEAVKAAGQKCVAGAPLNVTVETTPGFPVSTIPAGTLCPGPATTPRPFLLPLTLTVSGPLSVDASLDVLVRTP